MHSWMNTGILFACEPICFFTLNVGGPIHSVGFVHSSVNPSLFILIWFSSICCVSGSCYSILQLCGSCSTLYSEVCVTSYQVGLFYFVPISWFIYAILISTVCIDDMITSAFNIKYFCLYYQVGSPWFQGELVDHEVL